MISIKKYLDLDSSELTKYRPPNSEEILSSTLEAYRAALGAMGSCGLRACPTLGPGLQSSLMVLAEGLAKTVTPPLVKETEGQVEHQLQEWGEKTSEYFQQRAGDVKEILMVLARAAESVAERDQRYASQFGEFTKRLQALAKLEDLPQIRSAIVRGAKDLKNCVDKMEQDGRESVAALRSQVSTYETKLEEAERRASHDTLTGLDNRQGVETKLQRRIDANRPFCVVMLDLNGFKQVNDAYGHQAGDDLLKQFSTELRSASRSTDVVGRWGGDEFVVILDGNLTEAQSHLERMQKWVFGSYTLHLGTEGPKVDMDAAIGMVEWNAGEPIKDLLARADTLMYKQKAEMHRRATAAHYDKGGKQEPYS
ncbi:MAG: GGDEF domain-containing protein [Acidobacteriota bacterium]|nr:GGDEF domain-containing protein [Acidobacteriota bacterium]